VFTFEVQLALMWGRIRNYSCVYTYHVGFFRFWLMVVSCISFPMRRIWILDVNYVLLFLKSTFFNCLVFLVQRSRRMIISNILDQTSHWRFRMGL